MIVRCSVESHVSMNHFDVSRFLYFYQVCLSLNIYQSHNLKTISALPPLYYFTMCRSKMADYGSMEDLPWPDDIYDETGHINEERLMELLDSDPEFMEQFQCE